VVVEGETRNKRQFIHLVDFSAINLFALSGSIM
jgi:hypothetical protein